MTAPSLLPRYAPDPPARRVLEKILASAHAVDDFTAQQMLAVELYCALAYQRGLERGRRERGARRP